MFVSLCRYPSVHKCGSVCSFSDLCDLQVLLWAGRKCSCHPLTALPGDQEKNWFSWWEILLQVSQKPRDTQFLIFEHANASVSPWFQVYIHIKQWIKQHSLIGSVLVCTDHCWMSDTSKRSSSWSCGPVCVILAWCFHCDLQALDKFHCS